MKVYQLIRKFWYGASTIEHIYLCFGSSEIGEELSNQDILFPWRKDSPHYEAMQRRVNSFRINGSAITIYC